MDQTFFDIKKGLGVTLSDNLTFKLSFLFFDTLYPNIYGFRSCASVQEREKREEREGLKGRLEKDELPKP
jgi:hypothetical protein